MEEKTYPVEFTLAELVLIERVAAISPYVNMSLFGKIFQAHMTARAQVEAASVVYAPDDTEAQERPPGELPRGLRSAAR